MLYDWTGREIAAEKAAGAAITDRLVRWEAIDRYRDERSHALSPAKLTNIFQAANGGDPTAQAKLAEEILEKDWDCAHAAQTRSAAVEGVALTIKAADEKDAAAVKIAAAAQEMLDAVEPQAMSDLSTSGLIGNMMGALLPGYDCCEIQWAAGGKGIEGYTPIPRDAITFHETREPRIATQAHPTGIALAPRKFVFHLHRARGGDATRGGLIRPLGWMYLFGNLGVKDLMRFAEKFGMPFIAANVDENAWKQDRYTIADLIRNFGSDGGAVFSKAVEIKMLDSSASNGEVYFKLLEYFGQAKTKVILGQTAASGDAAGWSQGGAQAAVRQDILESDCKELARTIRNDILAPWTEWNYGPDAPVPVAEFECRPPADRKQDAEIAGSVSESMGYELDPDWIEEQFGVVLARDDAGHALRKAPAGPGALGLRDADDAEKKKRSAAANRPGGLNARPPPMTRW